MDIDTKERIYYIDKRIEELSMHAVMYAKAGGNSNTVMEEFARIEEINNEIQKTDFEISKLNSIEFEI